MANSVQQGAPFARLWWSDTVPMFAHWTGDVKLPVLDESYGRRENLKIFVGFHPFASHVIVADHWHEAYEVYVDAIADVLLIPDDVLPDYIVGYDSEGNPDYSEVNWTSGGEPVDTGDVNLYEIPVSAITWLAR